MKSKNCIITQHGDLLWGRSIQGYPGLHSKLQVTIVRVPVRKLSSAWCRQAGWNFRSLTWSDLFFTYLNTAKPPSFPMTIVTTKLKAWLRWNCFANYTSFAKCLRAISQGRALLTEIQCLGYGGSLPGLLYRTAKINRLLTTPTPTFGWILPLKRKACLTALSVRLCPLQVKAT